MKINKKLLMAALASVVIVSAPQSKTFADKQTDDTQAVTEKLIDDQLANAAQPAEQKNSEKAQVETEANADEKQNQQESSQLQSEKETDSKKTGFGSQALNHPAQATAVTGLGNDAENSGLELGEEKQLEAVQAGETGTEEDKNLQKSDGQPKAPKPLTDEEAAKLKEAAKRVRPDAESIEVDKNTGWITVKTKVKVKQGDKEVDVEKTETINPYTPAGDEALIKGYDENERYRSTQMEQGNGPAASYNPNDKESEFVDGYRYKTLEPGTESPDKKKWGFEIEIDKEKGQRTYTNIGFTNSGRMTGVLDPGSVSAKSPGDGKLGDGFKDPNYKADTKTVIEKHGQQINLNANSSEEDLKRINNINNNNTTMAWEGHYLKDNANGLKATQGSNASFSFTVNPWPNENDQLSLIKLEGEYKDKVFVQGQKINTGVKVQNLDENAKKRLVGQVYNPNTGKVVPGAKAYIDENGIVQVEMPKGAVNEDGTLNTDSIFYKDNDYKGIQSLDVRFFARPRTKAEFEGIIASDDENYGTYTSTGAGTKTINHNGEDVEVDLQGIDRYDHYNLIGNLKLTLDDTKYYEQKYKDQNGKSTKDNVFSEVEPGKEFAINMQSDFGDSKGELDKTPEDMKAAQDRKEATARANLQFFLENNQDKDGQLKPEEDRWKLSIGGKEVDLTTGEKEISVDNLSELKITAPESAKSGEFVAVPIEYTYTNGSKDVHWFHFVVKESDNNIPTYESEAGTAGKALTQGPTISDAPKDLKKNQPVSYKLAKTEYKDDKGNVWNVSIDETKGVVTATVPDNANIPEKGAKLDVDVIVTYEEEVTINGKTEKRTYTEKTKAQFYSIPSTKQEVRKEVESELPFKTKIEYDNTIPAGKVVEEGGKVGKQKLVFSQIVVGNKKGALDENGKFVEGKESITTEVVEKAVDKVIKIGTKPAETTVEIPKGLDYELDFSKKDGDPEVVEEGNDGVVTIKTTRDPQTGEITVTKTTTTKAKNKKIKIPAGTEGTHEYTEKKPFTYDVQFDPDFYKNYPDAKDNYKIVTDGKVGEKTSKWTIKNSEIVGEPEIIKDTDPTNAVIKVGQKDYTGTITHTESHEVPFEVEYKYSDELEAGQTKVEQKGEKGSYDVEYTQKIKNGEADGNPTSKKTNEKAAKKEIVVIGTKPVTKVVEKPFNTEYQYDKNLEAGKTEEVTPGKNGKVTITTSYDKDQKKVVTSETEEAGQNRVVKIGGKTNGTEKVKEEIPFEVEVRKDPSLKKGEWKYAKDDEGNELKGEKGEQEKTLTIVNSKVTETSDPTVTKQPKKAVILVGDEDFTGEVKHKEHFEIPFEVEIRYNKDLPAGKTNEIQKGVKGSYDVEYTQKIKNGSADGEMTKEESNKVEAKKHIIEVGTKVETPENNYSKEVEVEVEYVYDDTKDKGVVETGEFTPGKVETKVVDKYNPETGKVEQTTEEVVTKAKQKVIVGTKDFTGKYEYKKTCPIPFEVEIIEDDTLAKGTKVVDQVGKPGSKTTSYKQNIKNGQPDGEAEKTGEEVTEQPTKHIVRIGTKDSEGETTKTIEREIPYETKVIYDEDLEAGTQKIEKEGKPGKEEVTITQKIKDSKPFGDPTETTKTITEKEDRVVRIGVKTVVKETELGNNTEYKHNPELKAGEERVIEEGSKGSVKYTTTFNKETGKLEVTEERTEPKNKVVEYGSKTDGEFKYESEKAYDIIIRENPNLEAGKTNVIQEGKPGKTETTVKIENSKEVSRDTKTITEKQDKIIEIGTKNVCEIPPVKPEDPTKPGKEDPTKPGEKDPENPTKPGEKDPENPGTPGEKPNEPGTPGETPEENGKTPENNGKKPENNGKTPENNGKTPENNGKTPENNGKTPENNGKTPENNGKTPGNNGKTPDNNSGDSPNKPNETPKTPETTEQGKRKEKADTPNRESANKLPKAGSESEIMMLSMSALMTAAGFIGLKKKRKDR